MTSHRPTPSWKTKAPRWVFFLLLAGAVWFWFLQPLEWLDTQTPLDGQFPGRAFETRLANYQRASFSPIWRVKALQQQSQAIRDVMNPSYLAKTYRHQMTQGTISQWAQLTQRWEALIAHVQEHYPKYPIAYLKGYLWLYMGQWDRLQTWGQKRMNNSIKNRQEALLRSWMGHVAFWNQSPKQAQGHYDAVLRAFQKHPNWLQATSTNWRLPTEANATLYHRGILALQHNQPKVALSIFQRLLRHRTQLHRRPKSDKLRYAVHLWASLAAQRAKLPKQTQVHLRNACQFRRDRTLCYLAQGSRPDLPIPLRLPWLKRAEAKPKGARYSSPDSPWIARLFQARLLQREKKPKQALLLLRRVEAELQARRWPVTLGELQAKQTQKLRFFPLTPGQYNQLRPLFRWASQHPTPASHSLPSHPQNPPHLQNPATTRPTPTSRQNPPSRSKPHPSSQPVHPTHTQTRTTSRPSNRRPTKKSLISSHAKTRATSRPSSPTSPFRTQDWELLEVMAHLRLQQVEQATSLLRSFQRRFPKHAGALRLRALLLMETTPKRAISLWKQLYKRSKSPEHSVYYAQTLFLNNQVRPAQTLVQQLPQQTPWKATQNTLQQLFHAKPLSEKRRKRPGFWRWVLGSMGQLATQDPHLKRQARAWRFASPLQQTPHAWTLYRSLQVSRTPGRFNLLTLLTKFHRLTQVHPNQRRQWKRRLRAIQRIYADFPTMGYLLDQVHYNHYWGILGMGLYR